MTLAKSSIHRTEAQEKVTMLFGLTVRSQSTPKFRSILTIISLWSSFPGTPPTHNFRHHHHVDCRPVCCHGSNYVGSWSFRQALLLFKYTLYTTPTRRLHRLENDPGMAWGTPFSSSIRYSQCRCCGNGLPNQ